MANYFSIVLEGSMNGRFAGQSTIWIEYVFQKHDEFHCVTEHKYLSRKLTDKKIKINPSPARQLVSSNSIVHHRSSPKTSIYLHGWFVKLWHHVECQQTYRKTKKRNNKTVHMFFVFFPILCPSPRFNTNFISHLDPRTICGIPTWVPKMGATPIAGWFLLGKTVKPQ